MRKVRKLQIQEVLSEHDPMGLLSMGAPADEYAPEATRIDARLEHRWYSEEELLDVTYAVFVEMFTSDPAVGPRDNYRLIARQLMGVR
jgi:hypothetical protein